eukprot:6694185-Prymnesium_polylepis.2
MAGAWTKPSAVWTLVYVWSLGTLWSSDRTLFAVRTLYGKSAGPIMRACAARTASGSKLWRSARSYSCSCAVSLPGRRSNQRSVAVRGQFQIQGPRLRALGGPVMNICSSSDSSTASPSRLGIGAMPTPKAVGGAPCAQRASGETLGCNPAGSPSCVPCCMPDWMPGCMPGCKPGCTPGCIPGCIPSSMLVSKPGCCIAGAPCGCATSHCSCAIVLLAAAQPCCRLASSGAASSADKRRAASACSGGAAWQSEPRLDEMSRASDGAAHSKQTHR